MKTEPDEPMIPIKLVAMGPDLPRKLKLAAEFGYRWSSIDLGHSPAEWIITAVPEPVQPQS